MCLTQAMIARLSHFMRSGTETSLVNGDNNYIESIMPFFQDLLAEMSWLSKEISATHVVRSALCILAGIPILAEKKVCVRLIQSPCMF